MPQTLRLITYLRAMGVLDLDSPANWTDNLKGCYQQYKDLYETQYLAHKNVPFQDSDPLQPSENCPFIRRHKLLTLEKQIGLDINRLFSGDAFFILPDVRAAVHQITTVWCHVLNNDVYKQGIHEIFAFCYQITFDAIASNFVKHTKDFMLHHLTLLNKTNLNALAFALGTQLMRMIYQLYSNDELMTQRMGQIQNQLLLKLDQPLHERILQLNLESVYLIRWLRLLFCREVPLKLVPRLWDFIIFSFQSQKSNQFLDYLVISFYQQKRSEIMKNDYNMVMRLFSNSLLETIQKQELELVCQKALQLQQLKETVKDGEKTVSKPQNKVSHVQKYFAKLLKESLEAWGRPEATGAVQEVMELLEKLNAENVDVYWDVLKNAQIIGNLKNPVSAVIEAIDQK